MKVKISACTITKNEEKNIARSIESYKDYVDEIIIVDTGSTDNTVKIAESLGAKVIHFEWINDFSAARNCALNAATGDWILFLDADEWIKDNGGMKLQTIINRAETNGFNSISIRMLNLEDDGSLFEITSALRMFKNSPNIRYIRKIHEHLWDFEKNQTLLGLRVEDLVLNHSGYADSVNKSKIKRNKELLEKNYMTDDVHPIDYFYLARENTMDNPEYARQFLDMLINDEDKMNAVKKLDIANNIYDLEIKLARILTDKYTIDEQLKIVDKAIKEFPDNPSYYFFKYLILFNFGKYDNLELLKKAVELDRIYESKAGSNNNSFSRYKVEALYELAREAFRENDNLKAMEYFVQTIQEKQLKEEILIGLLYIIDAQELNEKIAFLNSLYDTTNQEHLKFLVQTLRLTKYKELFLYYFVKYYKTFGEVDISLFTSMMFNNNSLDAATKYLEILQNENEARAEKMVVCAILAGNLKDFFEANKNLLSPVSRKLVNSYFEDSKIEKVTEYDEQFIRDIIPEIIYISSQDVLERIKKIFDYNEKILATIMRVYYNRRDYRSLIQEINTFIENDLSDEFAGEVAAKLGESFLAIGEYSNAKLYLDQAIQVGYLDVDLVRCYEALAKKIQLDDIAKERFNAYKYLLERFIEAKNCITSEVIKNLDANNTQNKIEDFESGIQNTYNLTISFAQAMFEYAEKVFEKGALYLAEEYYKILIRANYNEGKCYYKLGAIYNELGVPELSYLCYERAFKTAIDFASSILPKNHKNKCYLYNKKNEEQRDLCPICGKEGELQYCYQYIEDSNLNSESQLIVKYRICKECSHIFAENYSKNEKYVDSVEDRNACIFNVNDVKEKLESDAKIVVIDETDFMQKAFLEDFDTTYVKGSFEKTVDVKELLEKADKDRILIAVINNLNSVLNEGLDMPLWAREGVINVYSKKSITRLLVDNGYKNIKIYDSKFIPGKMTVIAKM